MTKCDRGFDSCVTLRKRQNSNSWSRLTTLQKVTNEPEIEFEFLVLRNLSQSMSRFGGLSLTGGCGPEPCYEGLGVESVLTFNFQ